MIKIQVILASTREGRRGEQVGKWIFSQAQKREDLAAELLDLKELNLPFLSGKDDPEVFAKWNKKVAEADGFIIVTPEYNHGYPGVLKNALDHAYEEWNNKPVGFVAYSTGPLGGARSVEQLRQVVIELQMAPIREAVYVPMVQDAFDKQDNIKDPKYSDRVNNFFTQLAWWANALHSARQKA